MRKKPKLRSDGGYSGIEKRKRGYGDIYGGVLKSVSLRESRVWSQEICFVLVVLAGMLPHSP